MKVGIINGPNLNMLGDREPSVYGYLSLDSIIENIRGEFKNIEIHDFQSNDEGEIISKVQDWGMSLDALVINPGGYANTSVAIRDALSIFKKPKIEVHISNIYKREDFRHKSLISAVVTGIICGLGTEGYTLALKASINLIKK